MFQRAHVLVIGLVALCLLLPRSRSHEPALMALNVSKY